MQNTPWGIHTVLQKPLGPVEPTQEGPDIYAVYGLDLEKLILVVRPNLLDNVLLAKAWSMLKDEGRVGSEGGLVRRKATPLHEVTKNSFVADVAEPIRACVTVTVGVDDVKRRVINFDFEYEEERLAYLGADDLADKGGPTGITTVLSNLNPLHNGRSVPLRTELYQSIASKLRTSFAREDLLYSSSSKPECSTEMFLARSYRDELRELCAIEAEDDIQSVLAAESKRARVFEAETQSIIKSLRDVVRDAKFYPPPPRLFRGDIPRPKMFTSEGDLVTTLGQSDSKFESDGHNGDTGCTTVLELDEQYRDWLRRAVAQTTVSTTDNIQAIVSTLSDQHVAYRHKLLYWLENSASLQVTKDAVDFRKKYRFASEHPLCSFKCNRYKKVVGAPIPLPDRVVITARYFAFAAGALSKPIRVPVSTVTEVKAVSHPVYPDSGIAVFTSTKDVYIFGNINDRDTILLVMKTVMDYNRVYPAEGADPLGAAVPAPSPIEVNIVIEDAYENQRFYPFKGWTSDLLPGERPPFSDITGKSVRSLDDMDLPGSPEEWEWSEGWKLDMSSGLQGPSIDDQGWEYAVSFKSKNWSSAKEWNDCVRRRRWVRGCHIKDMLPRNLPVERNPQGEGAGDVEGDESEATGSDAAQTMAAPPARKDSGPTVSQRKTSATGNAASATQSADSLRHDSPADAVNFLVNEDEDILESNNPHMAPIVVSSGTMKGDALQGKHEGLTNKAGGVIVSPTNETAPNLLPDEPMETTEEMTEEVVLERATSTLSTRTTTPPPPTSPPSSDDATSEAESSDNDDSATTGGGAKSTTSISREVSAEVSVAREESDGSRPLDGNPSDSDSDSDQFFDAVDDS